MGFLKRKTLASVRTNSWVCSILSWHHYKKITVPATGRWKQRLSFTASNSYSFYLLPFRVLRVDMCHFRRIICFSLVLFICLSNFSGYYYFLIVLLGIKRHFWRAKKTRQHRNGIGDWPNVAFSWWADEVASCCMWYGYSFLVSFKVIRAQQGKISWVVAIGPQCPIYTTIVAWLCILRLWH